MSKSKETTEVTPLVIKFSETDKMSGVKSLSTQAGITCPRANKSEVCKTCYAMKHRYLYKNVKAKRMQTLKDFYDPRFVDVVVKEMFNFRFFRWFDSGDIASVVMIKKIIEIIERTPHVQHWLPTNSWDVPKFAKYFEKLDALPNVTVRFSSRKFNTPIDWPMHEHTSSMVATTDMLDSELPEGSFKCPAPKQNNKCETCRACYDKNVKIIVYKKH